MRPTVPAISIPSATPGTSSVSRRPIRFAGTRPGGRRRTQHLPTSWAAGGGRLTRSEKDTLFWHGDQVWPERIALLREHAHLRRLILWGGSLTADGLTGLDALT